MDPVLQFQNGTDHPQVNPKAKDPQKRPLAVWTPSSRSKKSQRYRTLSTEHVILDPEPREYLGIARVDVSEFEISAVEELLIRRGIEKDPVLAAEVGP